MTHLKQAQVPQPELPPYNPVYTVYDLLHEQIEIYLLPLFLHVLSLAALFIIDLMRFISKKEYLTNSPAAISSSFRDTW